MNGVYWHPTYMDQNVTRSFARTIHFDGLNRTNYHLLPNYKVTRIFLDGDKASGVVFRSSNGSTGLYQVKAKREVILAAGTIHSPQVLQLSGIGPKKLLQDAGIPVQVALPGVGQNFQDHPQLSITFRCMSLPSTFIYNLLLENWYLKFEDQNYTIHPNPDDMTSNQTFIAYATELWNTNKTGEEL